MKDHLYFVHVMKTGGTTITNILSRRALKRKLSLPEFVGKYLFSWPDPDIRSHMRERRAADGSLAKYDILLQHSVFNTSYKHLLLRSDVTTFTMLREPLAQFKSAFNFAKLDRKLGVDDDQPLLAFLRQPHVYERKYKFNGKTVSWTKNLMTSFFGYSAYERSNCSCCSLRLRQDQSECFISFMEDNIDAVLIHEHYDASLVYLATKLHWQLEDVLYLRMREKNYTFKHQRLPRTLVDNYRRWSPLDFGIYEHFRRKFEDILSKNENELQEKTKVFQEMNSRFQRMCRGVFEQLSLFSINNATFDDVITALDTPLRASGYTFREAVDGRDCVLLGLDPLLFQKVLSRRHDPRRRHWIMRRIPLDLITSRRPASLNEQ